MVTKYGTPTPPEPGLYHWTRGQYENVFALNQSTIKLAYERSLAHAKHELDIPSPPTDAMIEGIAGETLILEPELFWERFAIMPVDDKGRKHSRRTGAGNAAWTAYDEEHGGKWPLKETKIRELMKTAQRVSSSSATSELVQNAAVIDGRPAVQMTAIWEHPEYGFLCKAQIDLISLWKDWTVVVDLKKCADASRRGFSRQNASLSYFVQAWWYLEGLNAIAEADRKWMNLCYEVEPPYGVAAYLQDDESLWEAKFRCEEVAFQWDKALTTGHFPGYSTEPEETEPQPWAMTHRKRGVGASE